MFAAFLASALTLAGAQSTLQPGWSTVWATPMYEARDVRRSAPAGNGGAPVHFIGVVWLPVRADQVRIRLNNQFSRRPLRITSIKIRTVRYFEHAAPLTSERDVYFSGSSRTVVPAGKTIFSDPLSVPLDSGGRVLIDVLVTRTGRPAIHPDTNQTNILATGSQQGPVRSWYFVDRVEARTGGVSVVALGDSITSGLGGKIDARGSWPEQLASLIDSRAHQVSILNAGINGNALASDSECFGSGMVHRFRNDALRIRGVKYIVLAGGINDLVQPKLRAANRNDCLVAARPSLARLKMAVQTIVKESAASGVSVMVATVPPFGRSEYWDADLEQLRQSFNLWLRQTHAPVVDFDRVLSDPSGAPVLNPSVDSGDGLHPNDEGARLMAVEALRVLRKISTVRAAHVALGASIADTALV